MEKYLVYDSRNNTYRAYVGDICERCYQQSIMNTPANLKQFQKAGYIKISRKDFHF